MTNTSYVQGPWSLRELFSGLDAPEIQKEIGELEQQVQAFEALRPGLSPALAEKDFAAAVGAYDALLRKLSRLDGFAELSFAEDTQDPKVQSLQARMQQLGAETANRTLFFQLWWKALDDAAAARLLAAGGDFRYWLEALRLQKPYTLSEAEEKVINLKDVNGSAALVTLYDSITNRYTFTLIVDGEKRELMREELQVHFRSPRPEMRAAAYQAAVPGLRPGRRYPEPALPVPGARLAQRERPAARLRFTHRRPQSGQQHPRRRDRHAARVVPLQRRDLPALLHAEGQDHRGGPPAALRPVRPGGRYGEDLRLRRGGRVGARQLPALRTESRRPGKEGLRREPHRQ